MSNDALRDALLQIDECQPSCLRITSAENSGHLRPGWLYRIRPPHSTGRAKPDQSGRSPRPTGVGVPCTGVESLEMSTPTQLDAIKALHGPAAGRLIGQSLFELLADNVEWFVLGSPDILPWAGVYRGVAAVRTWFDRLGEHLQYQQFEPIEFIAQPDTVVEVIHASGSANAT